jgi:hypothetical protein
VGGWRRYRGAGGNTTIGGEIDVPLTPGAAVPSGDALCMEQTGNVEAEVSVSGYTVPSAAVTAEPLHAIQNITQ